MIKVIALVVLAFLIACGSSIVTNGETKIAAPTTDFLYKVDIADLKDVPRSAHGAHHGGLMGVVDFDGDDVSQAATDISNEVKFNFARFPGGGHLKFMHLMVDENGNPSKGYGYRRQEITDYINGGGGTSKDLEEWMQTVDQQETLDYNYLDRYIEYYHSLASPPDLIVGINVTLGTLSEEMDMLTYMISSGVNVVAVEMGNETYSQFPSWAAYFAKAKPFLEAIKAAYPSVTRTVVMAPMSGRNSHVNWNEGLKAELLTTDLIQGAVPHYYPKLNTACEDLFNAYIDPKKNFEIQYDTKDATIGPIVDCIDASLKEIALTGFDSFMADVQAAVPGIDLFITEWNFLPIEGASNTLTEAFYNFKIIRKIQEYSCIKMATFHNFVAPAGHGAVTPQQTNDSIEKPLHKRMKYYAFLTHSFAQDGFKEATHNFAFPDVTMYSYYKEGKVLIIGINEGLVSQALDLTQLGIDGYNTLSCAISGINGKQLYSSAGSNDLIAKNNFYKTSAAPYEVDGLKVFTEIPALSMFNINCTVEKIVIPPPPPPVTKPWYCKVFPFLKECKKR